MIEIIPTPMTAMGTRVIGYKANEILRGLNGNIFQDNDLIGQKKNLPLLTQQM